MIIGCDNSKTNKNVITIQLNQVNTDDTYFDERNSQFLLLSLNEIYSKFYNENLNSLKGIPKLDRVLIATESFQFGNYHLSAIFQDVKKKSVQFLSDTLKMSLLNTNLHLNVLSSFNKNEQIVIADANNNRDFSDDEVFKFNKNFRIFKNNGQDSNDGLVKIDTLPTISVSQQLEYDKIKYDLKRKIQIFPFSNYYYTQFLKNDSIKDLALMMRFKDYWKGELEYNSKTYNIGLQGMNKDRMTIMIKPKSYRYNKNDNNFNRNFKYNIKDTIQLDKDYYKIDSIDYNISKLFFKKITLDKDYFGKRIGNNIKDFELQDLNGKNFKISDVKNDSAKFTLLDFWGTWCTPCKKLTPKLKRIYSEYPQKLNIIGIARDKDIELVKNYVKENELNWVQAFDDRNTRSLLIRELRITSYPTFILIDKTGEIIYRGGPDSLNEIEKVIKLQSRKL